MMKAPTTSPTAANTSRKIEKNDRPCLMRSCCSLAAALPVIDWVVLGSTSVRFCTSCCWLTPGFAWTRISPNLPGVPLTICACLVVKSTWLAPPALSEVPNLAMPTSFTLTVPVGVSTSNTSPSL